jgi:hypothetical protein
MLKVTRALAVLLVLLTSLSAQAITFKVYGKRGEVLLNKKVTANLAHNVGSITMAVLKSEHIPFEGEAGSINSIAGLGSEMSKDADGIYRFYGWCYAVNGVMPEVMPDETHLKAQTDEVKWFYGYAIQKSDGSWVQCLPDTVVPQ